MKCHICSVVVNIIMSNAVRSDVWDHFKKGKTATCSTQAYNTVTAHFISPNLELNTLLVQMMSFPENHNVENISEKNQRDPSKIFIGFP